MTPGAAKKVWCKDGATLQETTVGQLVRHPASEFSPIKPAKDIATNVEAEDE
jgi:hypothetical protein